MAGENDFKNDLEYYRASHILEFQSSAVCWCFWFEMWLLPMQSLQVHVPSPPNELVIRNVMPRSLFQNLPEPSSFEPLTPFFPFPRLILFFPFVWSIIQFLFLSSFLELKSHIPSLLSTFTLLSFSWIYFSLGFCHKDLACSYLLVYLFMPTHMFFHFQYHKTVFPQGGTIWVNFLLKNLHT